MVPGGEAFLGRGLCEFQGVFGAFQKASRAFQWVPGDLMGISEKFQEVPRSSLGNQGFMKFLGISEVFRWFQERFRVERASKAFLKGYRGCFRGFQVRPWAWTLNEPLFELLIWL